MKLYKAKYRDRNEELRHALVDVLTDHGLENGDVVLAPQMGVRISLCQWGPREKLDRDMLEATGGDKAILDEVTVITESRVHILIILNIPILSNLSWVFGFESEGVCQVHDGPTARLTGHGLWKLMQIV